MRSAPPAGCTQGDATGVRIMKHWSLAHWSTVIGIVATLATGTVWGSVTFFGWVASNAELKREEMQRVASDQAEALQRVAQMQQESAQRIAQDLRLQVKIDVNSVRDDIARGESELAAIDARAERGQPGAGDGRRRQILEQQIELLVERLHALRIDQESIQ